MIMEKELTIRAEACYRLAEWKAEGYFAALYEHVAEKAYQPALTLDIQQWKKRHITRPVWLSLLWRWKSRSSPHNYHKHIQWLARTGKLESYLDRSISYIYMRDLGKALDCPDTQARIQRTTDYLKQRLTRSSAAANEGQEPELVSVTALYRWAQKEGVEAAVIWVIDKLKAVAAHIPEGMNGEHAQRKLVKIILGVVLHAIDEMEGKLYSVEARAHKLDQAIRLGYAYGLTYPFIDDLLDAQVLSDEEKLDYSNMIRDALLTGTVPELGQWSGANQPMIGFIGAELREAFEYIKEQQGPNTQHEFFQQAYIFFHAQELDRNKQLSHAEYTNEELYIPIILKSAYSRLIARAVLQAPQDEGFENRTFLYGIYNQLADDFADLFEDLKSGAVTPYTYYWTYKEQRPDLLNPYELYWAVIHHLLHHVYKSDPKAREVILNRAINGLKRCRARLGKEEYNKLMKIFTTGSPAFHRLIDRMVRQADDVDFFDKLLRDQFITSLKTEQTAKEAFTKTIQQAREQINNSLQLAKPEGILPAKEMLVDAANYCLLGDGKRLRPVVAWVMGVQEYGLKPTALMPLLRSLEYMHTASLIFDDLPSQDNASTRRGRRTLHLVHNSATAELTGLMLIQKAIQEQSQLDQYDPKTVLALIQYSARTAEELCMGQAMDLNARGDALTLEQLNQICWYKTGIGFEAALVMPAILAQVAEQELLILKKYAYHAGITFQIKDDLLDAEGDTIRLGKPVGQDSANSTSTFVTILGVDGARQAMWEHYCSAMDALKELPRSTAFLQYILYYMMNRDR